MDQLEEFIGELRPYRSVRGIINSVVDRPRRSACYAIRCLLSSELVARDAFASPSHLLKLMGSEMTWPQHLEAMILQGVLDDIGDTTRKQEPLRALLAGYERKFWNPYIETVRKLYDEEPKAVLAAFEAMLIELIRTNAEKTGLNPTLVMLGEMLGLNAIEEKLLTFVEDLNVFLPLGEFLSKLRGGMDFHYTLAAAAIDAPQKAMQVALRPSSALQRFGLIKIGSCSHDLQSLLRLGSMADQLLSEIFDSRQELVGYFMETTQKPALIAEDFPHLAEEQFLLTTYLDKVRQRKIKGANILLYGPPGTGKTEFARTLANSCGLTAYAVKSTDEAGEPVPGRKRLSYFAWLQHFMSEQEDTLLIFDEVEDVFLSRRADQSKAWINQQLESSAIPSIWISNSVDDIDEAYLRRFAFHLEFRIPPASVRERITRKNLKGLSMREAFIAGLASDDTLSPGQIGQAAEFTRLCCEPTGQDHERVMRRALDASQRAMGRLSKKHCSGGGHDECNFEYLNLDSNIPPEKLIASLARTASGSVFFYGLPGTGKTSLARHIATALGKPLNLKRASDLLDKYVGTTEKRIAEMFRQAESEGAVLFLDEADSFLHDRKGARASWEVTQVNELLQQMEAFNGIFICATNLMDEVDAAALRRFTFKIKFDSLDPEQRRSMFSDVIFGAKDAPISHEYGTRLDRLARLTPGDFATIRRQERLLGERYQAEAFLCLLEQECAVKDGQVSQSIGFVR